MMKGLANHMFPQKLFLTSYLDYFYLVHFPKSMTKISCVKVSPLNLSMILSGFTSLWIYPVSWRLWIIPVIFSPICSTSSILWWPFSILTYYSVWSSFSYTINISFSDSLPKSRIFGNPTLFLIFFIILISFITV